MSLKRTPTQKSGVSKQMLRDARAAFTLIEIMMVVFAIVALMAILALSFGAVRGLVHKSSCIAIQKTVQDAVRTAAAASGTGYGDRLPTGGIYGPNGYDSLIGGTVPPCPGGGTYTAGSYSGGRVPPPGVSYLSCSISGHTATSTESW